MQARLAAWATTSLWNVRDALRREDGQAMVEYTILLAIITVGVILAVIFVGGWVASKWNGLETALTGH